MIAARRARPAVILTLALTLIAGEAAIRPPTAEAEAAPKSADTTAKVPSAPDTLAEEEGCERADPQLAFTRLPRPLREAGLREMIGQLLVVSYSGTTADSAGVAIARNALRSSQIGGVLTFGHNIASASDTTAVNDVLRTANPDLPAIIAVDQEGGAVMRIKPSVGGPATPSAEEVGKGTLEEALSHYEKMANTLSDLGFTANFGPVVDLNVNPQNPVIARFGRSFGPSAQQVVDYAKTFIQAHHDVGISTALKHFPGHGSSTDDSHEMAIDLTPTWSRSELTPFADLIADGRADMVMIGHLKLDGVSGPGDLPASLSPVAIDGLLRAQLCFDGLVVSDDLAMDAVEKHWSAPEAARLMLEAGGDIALVSLPAEKGMTLVAEITDHLYEEAQKSPELLERIRHAYARIVNHKLDMRAIRKERSYASNEAAPQCPSEDAPC